MSSKFSASAKVGLFALLTIAIILYLTLRVSDFSLSPTGHYSVFVEMKSADNIDHKTPVQVAGIPVGVVDEIALTDHNTALLKLKIRKGVKLPKDAAAQVKTKGVLGDVFLELVPGKSSEFLESGGTIETVNPYADFSELTKNLNDVALNLKDISSSVKKYVSTDDSAFAKIMKNMEKLTHELAGFAGNNRQNMDQIVVNLRDLTKDLKGMVRENSGEVAEVLQRLESITQKIDEGKGTIGKLINDPKTGEKMNETLDNINEVVGGVTRLKTEIGYHIEYLGNTGDIKNYISLALKPRPDKYFLLEFVSDPDPSPTLKTTTTNVTAGGVTSTITTDTEEIKHNRLLISAQVAKKFYDFTFRGGLIESSGGVGIDYNKGPFGLQFSAFNFQNTDTQRPHLKAMATLNVTKGFYVLGGVDDFISKQHGPDWFFGAGLRFVDEDIKSLLGAFSLKP